MQIEQLKQILQYQVLPSSPSVKVFQPAAVLMPLFEKEKEVHLLAVLKADTEGYPWRNQVALPGGHVDRSDENAMMTAYREIKEELNIDASQIEMLGSLGYFQTIRQTEIETFVGVWNGDRSSLRFDPQEISTTLEISLSSLINTHIRSKYQGRRPDVSSLVYPVNEDLGDGNIIVWGVTAMMIHFFLEHLRIIVPEMFIEVFEKRSFH